MSDDSDSMNKDILKRFDRDEELMWPNKKLQNRQLYSNYLHGLVDNRTFVDASRIVEKGIKNAKNKAKNKNRAAKIVACFFLILFFGGAGISGYRMPETYHFQQTTGQHIAFSLYMLAIALTGVGLSAFICSIKDKDPEYDEQPEVFFNRLIARYFEVLKKMYPEMSDKYLKMFNQPDMEMARAIYSLIIINMPKRDVNKLQDIALSVNWRVYENKIDTMHAVEEQINQALAIIEKTLVKHPELKNAVKDAYMGKIPTTFFVVNKQYSNIERE